MKICFGCMNGIPDDAAVCPHCGYSARQAGQSLNGLRPGTVLNRKYLVGKVLGEGGFGITYIAYDMNLKTKIAIKEFYPSDLVRRNTLGSDSVLVTVSEQAASSFKAGMERYVREAGILSKFFNLPGIVSVKDFFYENHTAYIVMEYVDGISLKAYLEERGGRISLEETLRIMQPLLQSLSVIHQAQIIHRDISPDNIMVGKNGKITLIDFGAARVFAGEDDKSKTVVVKHGYAPIEQYARDGNQGAWTDIYGICATMYRMLTGNAPLDSTARVTGGEIERIRKVCKRSRVPKHIDDAILKGLSVRPEDRQQSVAELYQELYLTRQQLWERRKENLGKGLIVILLISMIAICLGFLGILGVYSLRNHAEKNVSEEEQDDGKNSRDDKDKEDSSDDEDPDDDKDDRDEEDSGQDEQTEEDEEQDESEQQPKVVLSESDPEDLKYACMVVRDGKFHSRSQDMTVGEIFDTYYDRSDGWRAQKDGTSGVTIVYYTGYKDSKVYEIIFEVYSDDTFKIIGATENGKGMSEYNAYVDQLLKSMGI